MKTKVPTPKRISRLAANSIFPQPHKKTSGRARKALAVFAVIVTTSLSACSSATNMPASVSTPLATSAPQIIAIETPVPTPQAQSVPQSTLPPTTESTPLGQSVAQQAVVQTALDPCLLVTSQEASTLAGVTFGSGVEGTSPTGLKTCTYGAQTTNVFMVEVAQAPDVKTAQTDKTQFLADLQTSLQQLTDQGIAVTEVPNFADGAVMGSISLNSGGIAVNAISMGFLKGTVFVGFSDLSMGGQVPSSDAMQAEATTVLGRLP
jgi:hypothetical protein